MPSTNTKEVQVLVRAKAMVEAMAIARVNIDLNQKKNHQATVPIVVRVTLPKGAKHLVKNAIIAKRKTIFPSTAGLSKVGILHPKQNLMVPDNHTMMYMT